LQARGTTTAGCEAISPASPSFAGSPRKNERVLAGVTIFYASYSRGQYHRCFNNKVEPQEYVSTPTRGGDAFGRELAESHRFGSLGSSLTFDGLLLWVSLHLWVNATSGDPLYLGSCFHMLLVALQEAKCTEGPRPRARGSEWSQGICGNQGRKLQAMRVAAATNWRPPCHPRQVSTFSLNHYVMIT
jgi:hypothetical protein